MADPAEAFDAVLLGAGQANNPLSRSLARSGRRVALVEKGKIGGTCVNTGCTPTKSMAASVERGCVAGLSRSETRATHPSTGSVAVVVAVAVVAVAVVPRVVCPWS